MTDDVKISTRQHANDQRMDSSSTANELRKAVNVLNTSDPKAPALNPFVQSQNQGSKPGQQQSNGNNGSKNQGKKSE